MFLSVYAYAYPAFYFEGDTLHWCEIGEACDDYSNFVQLQLNKKMPPLMNKENIVSIWVKNDEVLILTKSNYWILNYARIFEDEWYIDGPFEN